MKTLIKKLLQVSKPNNKSCPYYIKKERKIKQDEIYIYCNC